MLLISRQGKTRLSKWFVQMTAKVRVVCTGSCSYPRALPPCNPFPLSAVRHYDILAFWHCGIQEKTRAVRELTATVLSRPAKMCNFIEWQDKKVIYKRYASLFFVACVDKTDNELIVLEQIHLFVEVLDRYFGNVCELDIIFNFHKAYYILDELFIGGHLQETSKVEVLRICAASDEMMDESKEEAITSGRATVKGKNR
jgi:AP-1 complex subunit sigma 1/2